MREDSEGENREEDGKGAVIHREEERRQDGVRWVRKLKEQGEKVEQEKWIGDGEAQEDRKGLLEERMSNQTNRNRKGMGGAEGGRE